MNMIFFGGAGSRPARGGCLADGGGKRTIKGPETTVPPALTAGRAVRGSRPATKRPAFAPSVTQQLRQHLAASSGARPRQCKVSVLVNEADDVLRLFHRFGGNRAGAIGTVDKDCIDVSGIG